jgi:flagellar hook protein FlgE
MMGSLYAGVSGLRNHQTKMNVIGNNIANVNTIGYKTGRVTFREALVQTVKGAGRPTAISGGTNPVQIGLGMNTATVDNIFQQGGLELTSQTTDLAIQGYGFFVLSDGSGNYYTRAGSFNFDANSYLVDPSSGFYVQGRMADSTGVIPSSATTGNIQLPFGQQDPPKETERIIFGNNIDSTATDASATLVSAGTTGIDAVLGKAFNGAGGTHTLTITGSQATRSTNTGTNITGSPLNGNMTLADIGVTDPTGFSISVDGGTPEEIMGLTLTSTINDLISALNAISGCEATLTASGEVEVSRTKAGAGATYSIQSSAAVNSGGDIDIVAAVFGVADGATFTANNGTDHSFSCIDSFTSSGGVTYPSLNLNIVVNDETGLATGISGLGGSNDVTIRSFSGISAGTCVINTADTIHSTSITVYDSQGNKHTLTFDFIRTADFNEWRWEAGTLGTETIRGGGSGRLTFNPDGSLLAFEFDGAATRLNIDPNNGASTMSITVDAGTAGAYDGLTSFGSSHTASILQQDGYGLGILDRITIDYAGNINGVFTNGISRVLAQIYLADFNNRAGLLKAGQSLFQESANSGPAIEGVAGQTISGMISSGALESSAVDIAQEFTSMITTQRGFQANSRIITTSDEMLEELVNIKR